MEDHITSLLDDDEDSNDSHITISSTSSTISYVSSNSSRSSKHKSSEITEPDSKKKCFPIDKLTSELLSILESTDKSDTEKVQKVRELLNKSS